MNKVPLWQTNSIFLSSTFNDFQAERDLLRNDVFPVIEEKLRNHNYSLVPIDLRWGVDTASFENEMDREYHILKVCLNVIKRSRPFIIVFLGDRYGWIPPEDIMKGVLMEEGFQSETDQSVTALEINYGILETLEDVTPLFYFREPLPYHMMDDNSKERYSDKYLKNKELSFKKINKLASLKRKILETSHPIRKYAARWDEKNKAVTGLEELREKLIEDIWSILESELQNNKVIKNWQEMHKESLNNFVSEHLNGLVKRNTFEDVKVLINALPGEGLLLLGELGSGKSSTFAYLYGEYLQDNYFILGHSTQMGEGEVDEIIILHRWIYELSSELGILYSFEERKESIKDEAIYDLFADCLEKVSTKRKVIILVDNAHQIVGKKDKKFSWLEKVPVNVKLCFTSTSDDAPQFPKDKMSIYNLKLFDENEARCLFELLCERHSKVLNDVLVRKVFNIKRKDLEEEIYAIQIDKAEAKEHDEYHPLIKSFIQQLEPPLHAFAYGNPLWLRHVYEELYYINEFDLREIYKINGLEHEKINHLLSQRIEGISSDFEGIANQLLKRAEDIFGFEVIKLFTSLIATLRYGTNKESIISLINSISTSFTIDNLEFARLLRFFKSYLTTWDEDERYRFRYQHIKAAVFKRYLSQENLKPKYFEIMVLEIQVNYFKNSAHKKEKDYVELDRLENILGERYLEKLLTFGSGSNSNEILELWSKYIKLIEKKINLNIDKKSIRTAIQVLDYFQENIDPLELRFMVQHIYPRKHKDFIQHVFTNNSTETKKIYVPFEVKSVEIAFTLGRYLYESKLDYRVKNLFIGLKNEKSIDQKRNKNAFEQIELLMRVRESWHSYID